MLEVIADTNIYGLWGAYILDKLTDTKFSIKFEKGVNIKSLEDSANSEDSLGVVLLKPIQESQVESVEAVLQEFDTPFTSAYHFANWGEEISIDVSVVDVEVNLVTKLVETVDAGDAFIKFIDEDAANFAREISKGLQSHHLYDGGVLGKNLMLLSEFYKEDLLNNSYNSIEDMGDKEEKVLKRLNNNMKEYVGRKVGEANLQVLNSGVIVVSLLAERYVNELGRTFIESLTANGSRVVVLIGQQTKGDDLYRIRTSEGVSASQVAHELNRGKGKERAATVFLPKGNTPIYNTIIRTLNSANI